MTTAADPAGSAGEYDAVLRDYLLTGTEEALYRASQLSRTLVDGRVGPDDLIALHSESVERVLETLPPLERVRAFPSANQFLLEVMIAYGVHHRQYLDLAEQSDRDKQRVIDFIAHELRTPLTSARGFIDLASRSVLGGQLGMVPGYLEQAKESLTRLNRLSTMLVAASRGETPHLELGVHDLRQLAKQAVDWALPMATDRGIALSFDGRAAGDPADAKSAGEAAPVLVRANADAVLTAIGNLLSNACRYTPAGGSVDVACRAEGDDAVVTVTDNGPGMSDEVQARIFERFYRGPGARASGAEGMGLGLFLSRELIKASGGTLEVESVPERGSTFTICLPVHRPEASVPAS